jgi:phosphomannomutase
MQAVKAVIGGEGNNGGIIFPAVHYCRNSYTGMAFILDRMARTGRTPSQLVADFPRDHRKLGKTPFEHGRLGPIMQALEQAFPGAAKDRSDGLKLMQADGWIHVRASNTEPILRLAAEAKSPERLDELYETVMKVLS